MLRPVDHIPATGNDRNQDSYQCSLGDVSQVQAGTAFEKLLAQTPSPTVRRSNNSDDMLCIENMGTHQKAWKNDTVGETQNVPSHHSSCTNDESEDGKSDISHNNQDSDVSFKSDNDEEIDAAEIEEEDWIEDIERSTNDAMEKMENEKILLEYDSKKTEMEIGDENRFITEWEMVDKSCWMESRTQLKIHQRIPRTSWGRDWESDRKQTTKSTKIGSIQQKTAENGLYSMKITQRIQKEDMKTIREREEILIPYQRGTLMECNWATKN